VLHGTKTLTAPEEYMACGHNRYAAINHKFLHRARHLCISLGHLPSDDGLKPVFMVLTYESCL
jgi:hypothetical protein